MRLVRCVMQKLVLKSRQSVVNQTTHYSKAKGIVFLNATRITAYQDRVLIWSFKYGVDTQKLIHDPKVLEPKCVSERETINVRIIIISEPT